MSGGHENRAILDDEGFLVGGFLRWSYEQAPVEDSALLPNSAHGHRSSTGMARPTIMPTSTSSTYLPSVTHPSMASTRHRSQVQTHQLPHQQQQHQLLQHQNLQHPLHSTARSTLPRNAPILLPSQTAHQLNQSPVLPPPPTARHSPLNGFHHTAPSVDSVPNRQRTGSSHAVSATQSMSNPGPSASSTCQFCGKTYSRPDYLRTHIAGRHSGQKMWSCSLCGKQYKWRSSLSHHLKTAHNDSGRTANALAAPRLSHDVSRSIVTGDRTPARSLPNSDSSVQAQLLGHTSGPHINGHFPPGSQATGTTFLRGRESGK